MVQDKYIARKFSLTYENETQNIKRKKYSNLPKNTCTTCTTCTSVKKTDTYAGFFGTRYDFYPVPYPVPEYKKDWIRNMGLIIDLSGESMKKEAVQTKLTVFIKAQEPASKQDPCPVSVPDAELISRRLQYLAGITEDLTGWALWKRIEQGKEYRFALDATGVIRWNRVYLRKESL